MTLQRDLGDFPGGPVVAAAANSLQSCLILCDTMNCNPPGSSVNGILQARTWEQVVMPSSRRSFQLRDPTHITCRSLTAGGILYH